MKISVFASGSGGNCSLISSGNSNLLIDAGISLRRIETAIRGLGLDRDDISGVLVTHEHSDHVSGLKTMLKRWDVPIYAPATVAERLVTMLPEIAQRILLVSPGCPFQLAGFKVTAFRTPHDTRESVGYRVEADGIFALATDLGHVTEEVLENLTGADTVLIEANHDPDMLKQGPYPFQLKQRILSDHGHLSNQSCGELARYLVQHGTRQVILGHISKDNNRPELALMEVRRRLGSLDAGVYCAPALGELSLAVKEGQTCWL